MIKIYFKGKYYRAKRLYRLQLCQKGCAFLKIKEQTLFRKGIIAIKMNDKWKYLTPGDTDKQGLFFYQAKNEDEEILFESEEFQEIWEAVYVYFFDEDGAFLLYVDKKCLLNGGIQCKAVDAYAVNELRREALNVAALCNHNLYDMINRLEYSTIAEETEISMEEYVYGR